MNPITLHKMCGRFPWLNNIISREYSCRYEFVESLSRIGVEKASISLLQSRTYNGEDLDKKDFQGCCEHHSKCSAAGRDAIYAVRDSFPVKILTTGLPLCYSVTGPANALIVLRTVGHSYQVSKHPDVSHYAGDWYAYCRESVIHIYTSPEDSTWTSLAVRAYASWYMQHDEGFRAKVLAFSKQDALEEYCQQYEQDLLARMRYKEQPANLTCKQGLLSRIERYFQGA